MEDCNWFIVCFKFDRTVAAFRFSLGKLCRILNLTECYFTILPAKDKSQAIIIAHAFLLKARDREYPDRYLDLYPELSKYLSEDSKEELLSIIGYDQTDTLKVLRGKIEELVIEATLLSNKGNISRTAIQLQVHRKTVYRKMRMTNLRRI